MSTATHQLVSKELRNVNFHCVVVIGMILGCLAMDKFMPGQKT